MRDARAIEFHHARGKFYWALAIDGKYQEPADTREIQLQEFAATTEMTANQVNNGLYSRAINDGNVFIQGTLYQIIGWAGFFMGYDLSRYFVRPFTWGDLLEQSKLNEQDFADDSDLPF